jgi:uncharacterized protein
MDMKIVKMASLIAMIVGAINMGLVGLISLNLISLIFGSTTIITRLIYIVIGAAGVYEALLFANVIQE